MLYFFTAGKTLEALALRVVCKALLRCTVGGELLLEAGTDEHRARRLRRAALAGPPTHNGPKLCLAERWKKACSRIWLAFQKSAQGEAKILEKDRGPWSSREQLKSAQPWGTAEEDAQPSSLDS